MGKVQLKEGWSTFGLLLLLCLSSIWAVQRAAWMPNLSMLPWIGVAGLVVGLVLAKLRLPALLLIPLGAVLGLGWITYVVSSLAGSDLSLAEKVYYEWRHVVIWFDAIWYGDMLNDEMTMVTLLGLLTWGLTFTSAWLTFRAHRIWPVLLVNAALLFSTVLYSLVNLSFFLFLFIAAGSLLVLRFNQYRRESEWQAHGVAFASNTRRRLMRTGMLIILVIGLLSWFFPKMPSGSAVYAALNGKGVPWQRAEQTWARMFYYTQSNNSGFASFNQSMTLGGSVSLGDAVVMYVSADSGHYWRASTYDRYTGSGWTSSDTDSISLPRDAATFERDPGPQRQLLVQAYRVASPRGNLLFTAGEPMKVDVPAIAALDATVLTKLPIADQKVVQTLAPDLRVIANEIRERSRPSLSSAALPMYVQAPLPDYSYVTTGVDAAGTFGYKYASGPVLTELNSSWVPVDLHDPSFQGITELHAQDTRGGMLNYTVVSSVSVARADELRRAGKAYPAWVSSRYLQVPATVTLRTRDLAAKVTRGLTNDYDKAMALETYLRSIPYSQRIAPPPPGADAVDHFLFTARQGWCEYYSSAMVIMARSLGIPAREATGFRVGQYDSERGVFVVREADAHAWPELYFPGAGWVEFEPTGYQPAIDREPGASRSLDEQQRDAKLNMALLDSNEKDSGGPGIGLAAPEKLVNKRTVGGLGIFIASSLFTVLAAAIFFWRRSTRNLESANAAYEKMRILGRFAGLRPRHYQTPFEYGSTLAVHMPAVQAGIDRIVQTYVRHRFGRKPVSRDERERLRAAWVVVRNQLLRRMLRRR